MKQIKVLIADDHALVREGIRNLIQGQEDMTVVGEAATGEKAIELTADLTPDVILMDIAMPDLNGIEATRQIKTLYPGVCVLILSAYDNEEFIFAVLEAKASGYLLKNVKGEELLNSVRAVYQGESILHPVVTRKVLERLREEKKTPVEKEPQYVTQRELQIITLGARGMVNKEIAYELSISDRTVQSHWRNIFIKLGVCSKIEAIMFCVKNNLIKIDKM